MLNQFVKSKETNPRRESQQLQRQRVVDSPSLAAKFPKLKSLAVDLAYYGPDGVTSYGQIKYSVNLDNAKSVFSFECRNGECVGGEFDLSKVIAAAVRKRLKNIDGEMRCQGWRSKDFIDSVFCRNLLRYRFKLAYRK